jgi:hypothetical protein
VSILSDFEDSVSRAVEGVFAGVFRSRVQPAEMAKALGKEMDRRRVVGIGKIYAPNLFTIVISPADEQRLGSFTETLAAELATYLVGYAREKGYSLEQRPFVRFRVHDALKLGRFEVLAELVSASELAEAAEEAGFYVPPEDERPPRIQADSGPGSGRPSAPMPLTGARRLGPGVTLPPSALPIPTPGSSGDVAGAGVAGVAGAGAGVIGAVAGASSAGSKQQTIRALSTITVTGVDHDVVLNGERVIVGRASTADIRLGDSNVSREHAALEREDSGWSVRDLGSTNGTFVNGEPVQHRRLRNGDVIVVGVSELVYHEPRI